MASIHVTGTNPAKLETSAAGRAALVGLLCLVSFLVPFTPGLFQSGETYGLAANRTAPDFQLTDSNGNIKSLSDFGGQFVYLMFGYLDCPDVCHSQVFTFQELDHFTDTGRPLSFVFVSIDPARDDAARLAAYFDQRGDNFVSLTSADTRYLQNLANAYNGYFYNEPGGTEDSYGINHAGYFYLLDPLGRIRYTYSSSQRHLQSLLGDLRTIDKDYNLEL